MDYFAYFIPILFLFEWFLNHPSMRYGGYVLFAIPIFLLTSSIIQKFNIEKRKLWNLSVFFIVLVLIIFNVRNISRITKETKIYSYDVFKSPYFYIQDVESVKIIDTNQYSIYTTKNGEMCWASKTPCSYRKNLEVKKFLWMNMVYRDVK